MSVHASSPFELQPLIKNVMILIDHDNVKEAYSDPKAVVTTALNNLSNTADIIQCTLRAYGGWFEGTTPTESRHQALLSYQEFCPALIRTNRGFARIAFEFADELAMTRLRTSKIEVRYTVALRQKVDPIVASASHQNCAEPSCELRKIRKWARGKSACPLTACPHTFVTFFKRRQQKQVDVHLAVDFMWFASTCDADTALILASDDYDLYPALLHASIQNPGKTLIRLHSQPSPPTYSTEMLARLGLVDVLLPEGRQ